MSKSATRFFFLILSASLIAAVPARAQSVTPFGRFMSHIDLGLGAPIEYTKTTSGTYDQFAVQSQAVSTSAGFIGTLRYTHSPLIGAEMNFKFARFAQNYTYLYYPVTGSPYYVDLGVDSSNKEISWGYIAHARRTYSGFNPYAGIGLGTIEFKPTKNGGEGYQRQFRAAYYWNLGTDYTILDSHFGVRVQVRQLFYKAPDFGQNYLTSGAHTNTIEPSIGFFARF